MRAIAFAFFITVVLGAGTAHATDTIKYTYDVKGRLIEVKIVRTTQSNNDITTTYSHDKADNRTNVKVVVATKP